MEAAIYEENSLKYNKTVKLCTLKRKNKNMVRILTLSDSLINRILIYEKKKILKRQKNPPITIQAVNNSIKKYFK